MFGIKSTQVKLSGSSAREAREKMIRVHSNNLNESEKQQIAHIKEITKKYNVVWK